MPAHVIGVYRERFADSIAELVKRQVETDWTVGLWALDEVVPALEAWTVGRGGGGKFDLLNEVLVRRPVPRGSDLIVSDDDISLAPHSFRRLLEFMAAGGLDLAQPAHARGSGASHAFNRRHRLSRARLTRFVEIGPVFAIRGPWISRATPFPSGLGMGWGLEVMWSRLTTEGCRLGVVDAVVVHHPEAPSGSYSAEVDAEFRRMNALLAEDGYDTIWELQTVLGTWRPWQKASPWSR